MCTVDLCLLSGYVIVWSVPDEERDYELQGSATLVNERVVKVSLCFSSQ